METASRLKALRTESGITQRELADAIGVALQSIINYENGRREPNSKAMAALERYFNVSGEYLRGESDERFPTAQWNDPEIMTAVKDSLSTLMAALETDIRAGTDKHQKAYFDMLEVLRHALHISDQRDRDVAVEFLHSLLADSLRFIDSRPASSKETPHG